MFTNDIFLDFGPVPIGQNYKQKLVKFLGKYLYAHILVFGTEISDDK